MKFNPRTWHNWISFALVIPILLVAVTAVFIAHNKAQGLKDIDVTAAVGWLPGYSEGEQAREQCEIGSTLRLADGHWLLDTKVGLFELQGDKAQPVASIGHTQVRDLPATPFGILLAAKNGVWLEQQGQWRRALKGDAWSLSLDPAGDVLASIKDKAPLRSSDGQDWQEQHQVAQALALAALPAQAATRQVSLDNLVMDLHTGKALLGKKTEWVWIDAVGLVMSFLGLTGIYLWWCGERSRREMLLQAR